MGDLGCNPRVRAGGRPVELARRLPARGATGEPGTVEDGEPVTGDHEVARDEVPRKSRGREARGEP